MGMGMRMMMMIMGYECDDWFYCFECVVRWIYPV